MNTRLFGEIDIQKDKVICFENGIIGFPDYKEYALIYDSEKKDKKAYPGCSALRMKCLRFRSLIRFR